MLPKIIYVCNGCLMLWCINLISYAFSVCICRETKLSHVAVAVMSMDTLSEALWYNFFVVTDYNFVCHCLCIKLIYYEILEFPVENFKHS